MNIEPKSEEVHVYQPTTTAVRVVLNDASNVLDPSLPESSAHTSRRDDVGSSSERFDTAKRTSAGGKDKKRECGETIPRDGEKGLARQRSSFESHRIRFLTRFFDTKASPEPSRAATVPSTIEGELPTQSVNQETFPDEELGASRPTQTLLERGEMPPLEPGALSVMGPRGPGFVESHTIIVGHEEEQTHVQEGPVQAELVEEPVKAETVDVDELMEERYNHLIREYSQESDKSIKIQTQKQRRVRMGIAALLVLITVVVGATVSALVSRSNPNASESTGPPSSVVWFGNITDPVWDPAGSWKDGKRFCEEQDKALCTYDQLCPNGGATPPASDPFEGGTPTDQWVPIEDTNSPCPGNTWVQTGRRVQNPASTCLMHHYSFSVAAETFESCPHWGEGGDAWQEYEQAKQHIPCCDPVEQPTVANIRIEWYSEWTEPAWEQNSTWMDGESFCANEGKSLCSYEELCPDGPDTELFSTEFLEDVWVPILNDEGSGVTFCSSNSWVQVGKWGGGEDLTCTRHEDFLGCASWGPSRESQPLRALIPCCPIPTNEPPNEPTKEPSTQPTSEPTSGENQTHSISWFSDNTDPAWSPASSWRDGQEFCQEQGKSLCTHRELCPNGASMPPASDPFKDQTPSDQWVPILDDASPCQSNSWVQVGTWAGGDASSMCTKHEDSLGCAPWGLTNESHPFKAMIPCCIATANHTLDEPSDKPSTSPTNDIPTKEPTRRGNQTNSSVTWFSTTTEPAWSASSWSDGQKFCRDQGMDLCAYAELCPNGGAMPPASDPFDGREASDQWVPILDDASPCPFNSWVQAGIWAGSDENMTCKKHEDWLGCAQWGLSTESQPFRLLIPCCSMQAN